MSKKGFAWGGSPLFGLLAAAASVGDSDGQRGPGRKPDDPSPAGAFGKPREPLKHPGGRSRIYRLPPPDTSPRRTRGTWKGYA